MSENQPDYWRKKLKEDPGNFVYQKLLEMAEHENPQPITHTPPKQIEDEDPEDLGRHGDCDVALEILSEIYPSGVPHRLISDRSDFAHTFLLYQGQPLDICGVTTIEEMRRHFNDPSLRSEPVTLEQVRTSFRIHRNPEDKRRTKSHLRKHILKGVGTKFPPPEFPVEG